MSEHWLVRTSENWIAGPFTEDKLRQLIQAGELQPQDEICLGGGYWFYLHEEQEVRQRLGVELPHEVTPTHPDSTQVRPDPDEGPTDPSISHREIPRHGTGSVIVPRKKLEMPILWRAFVLLLVLAACWIALQIFKRVIGV